MSRKKVRGLSRKTEQMIYELKNQTNSFPTDFYINYWNCYLPVAKEFIESNNTPMKVKRLCLQTLINQVEYLRQNKPADEENYRVMAMIQLPSLWYSQIIIFKGDEYFTDFFNRNTDYQKWTAIQQTGLDEWQLKIPATLQVQGYLEEILEGEGAPIRQEIFFIGELD